MRAKGFGRSDEGHMRIVLKRVVEDPLCYFKDAIARTFPGLVSVALRRICRSAFRCDARTSRSGIPTALRSLQAAMCL